jgi:hypothetical protein
MSSSYAQSRRVGAVSLFLALGCAGCDEDAREQPSDAAVSTPADGGNGAPRDAAITQDASLDARTPDPLRNDASADASRDALVPRDANTQPSDDSTWLVIEPQHAWTLVDTTYCSTPGGRYWNEGSISPDGITAFENNANVEEIVTCDGMNAWDAPLLSYQTTSWGLDAAHNLFHATEVNNNARYELVVTKYGPSGAQLWQDRFATGTTRAEPNLLRVGAHGVYIHGHAGGQLPGQPPAAAGKPFTIRYTLDGQRAWVRQETDVPVASLQPTDLALDAEESVYALGSSSVLRKIDRDGQLVWQAAIDRLAPKEHFTKGSYGQAIQVRPTPDGSSVFVFGSFNDIGPALWYVLALDGTGQVTRSLSFTLAHQEIIEPVEGVEWSGVSPWSTVAPWEIRAGAQLAVSNDGVFWIGNYLNFYEHGALRPPSFASAAVVRLSLGLELSWARHYRIGPLQTAQGETGSTDSVVPLFARFDTAGKLVISSRTLREDAYQQPAQTGFASFRLDRDGNPE